MPQQEIRFNGLPVLDFRAHESVGRSPTTYDAEGYLATGLRDFKYYNGIETHKAGFAVTTVATQGENLLLANRKEDLHAYRIGIYPGGVLNLDPENNQIAYITLHTTDRALVRRLHDLAVQSYEQVPHFVYVSNMLRDAATLAGVSMSEYYSPARESKKMAS